MPVPPWNPGFSGRPRPSQVRSLRNLGLNRTQRRDFYRGDLVVFEFPTPSSPAIAAVQILGTRLRSGIISIRDVGGGVADFGRFRRQSLDAAKAFRLTELELFGGAIINPRLEAMLLRHGFCRLTAPIPDALGGGTMEILSRVYPVQ